MNIPKNVPIMIPIVNPSSNILTSSLFVEFDPDHAQRDAQCNGYDWHVATFRTEPPWFVGVSTLSVGVLLVCPGPAGLGFGPHHMGKRAGRLRIVAL